MPTSSLIDKQKLIDAINAASADTDPCADQRRYIYNLGRSVLAKYLLAEIALGHLDAGDERNYRKINTKILPM